MAATLVMCKKLGRELDGFDPDVRAPWPGEIGQRIQREISKEAWRQWLEHAKMLINEYRLNLGTPEAQAFIATQMEDYFFGEGGAVPPPDFVPPSE